MFFFFLLLAGCKENHKTISERAVVAQPKELAPTTTQIIHNTLEELKEHQLDSFPLYNDFWLHPIYKSRDYKTIWMSDGNWNPEGDSLLHLLNNCRTLGLFPEHYQLAQLTSLREQTLSSGNKINLDASLWAKADLLLTAAFVELVKDLKIGRLVRDSILEKDSAFDFRYFNLQLKNFQSKSTSEFVSGLEPKHYRYHELKLALQDFLKTADFRRHIFINRKDSAHLRENVAARLNEEDSFHLEANDSLALSRAIKKYQTSKSVKADGKIGPQLINLLNQNDLDRFTRIAITLDRYKILPPLPETYLWVNIPSFRLELIVDDISILSSKIVVGKPGTRTPILTSAISDMITYPQWTIPNSIIKKDILPALKKDPGYLAKKGYSLSDGSGVEIDPYSIDWSKYNKGIPYKIIQGSGDANALGVLKFNFPNKFSVYLHDTNQRYLFGQQKRALSHGCVRVQSWKQLAYYLLDREQVALNATPKDSLDAWLERKEKHIIPLRKHLPLYIRYFTCAAENGKLVFYEDIYGEDRKLREQFFAQN